MASWKQELAWQEIWRSQLVLQPCVFRLPVGLKPQEAVAKQATWIFCAGVESAQAAQQFGDSLSSPLRSPGLSLRVYYSFYCVSNYNLISDGAIIWTNKNDTRDVKHRRIDQSEVCNPLAGLDDICDDLVPTSGILVESQVSAEIRPWR